MSLLGTNAPDAIVSAGLLPKEDLIHSSIIQGLIPVEKSANSGSALSSYTFAQTLSIEAAAFSGTPADEVITSKFGDEILSGGGGRDTFVFDNPSGAKTITDFGGVGGGGRGEPKLLPEFDVLKFQGSGLTSETMLLTYDGRDTTVKFDGVPEFQLVLSDFDFTDLDNLPSGDSNIIFDGESVATDSYDVFNDNSTKQRRLYHKNTVTHLNNANNRVTGERSGDVINGMDGNDRIQGKNGNDILRGQAGNDQLFGGNGKDKLEGGQGHDLLKGENGRDFLDGGEGDDRLFGGNSRDTLFGGAGDDLLKGENGKDELTGGTGQDRLEGGNGDDILYGGLGRDHLFGGRGNDVIWSDQGGDQVYGGRGNDDFWVASEIFPDEPSTIRDFCVGRNQLIIDRLPGVTSFSDLSFRPGHPGVIISAQGQDIVIIADKKLGELDAHDFHIIPGDKVDPPELSVSLTLANDTGVSGSDQITSDPTISGSVNQPELVSALSASFGGAPIDITAQLQPNGSFSLSRAILETLQGGSLVDGNYTLAVAALDESGQVLETTELAFALDTTVNVSLALAASSDSEPVGDGVTQLETVTLTGQTEPGETVTLVETGERVVADAAGQYAFSDVTLELGENTFSATITDVAGNTVSGQTVITRVSSDTDNPVISATLANDTGSSNSDRLTGDPTVQGSIVDDNLITSLRAGFGDAAAVDFVDISGALSGGSFVLDQATLEAINGGPLADGAQSLKLIATDEFGNESDMFELAFVLDTQIPSPTIELAAASDSDEIGDLETVFETVILVGVTEPNAQVALQGTTLSTQSDEEGRYAFSDVALTLGENAFTVTATDAAGNVETVSTTIVRTPIDSDNPVISAALANDTGLSNSDGLTLDPSVQGTISDSNEIASLRAGFGEVAIDEFVDVTAVLNDGSFVLDQATLETVNGGPLADGAQVLKLVATDEFGNESEVFELAFALDSQLPALTVELAADSDSGAAGDLETVFETVTLVGVTEPNTQVELQGAGAVTQSDTEGNYAFDDVALALGENAFTVTATDAAGNVETVTKTVVRTPLVGDAPTLIASLTNDTGDSDGDGLTLDPTIGGEVSSDLPIRALQGSLDGVNFIDLTDALTGDGGFTLALAQYERLTEGVMPDGVYTVTLRAIDEADQVSSPVAVAFSLDRTAPAIEYDLAADSDTGVLGDRTTTARRVTLVGQTDPGLRVVLVNTQETVTADGDGNFTFTDVEMPVAGSVPFTVVTVDAAGNQGQAVEVLTREGVNGGPTITSTPVATFDAAQQGTYTYQVVATDPDGDALSYVLIDGPSGAEIDSKSGLISFTPDGGLLPEYDFVVEVTDGRGGKDAQNFAVIDPAVGTTTGEIRGTKWADLNGDGNREPANLIVNGDFSLGDFGFSAERDKLFQLNVGSDPFIFNSAATSYGDHTTGDGQMLIINGGPDEPAVTWEQTVDVNPNTNYDFGLWLSTWFSREPAQLQLLINDELIEEFPASTTTGVWENFTAQWTADERVEEATITLRNLRVAFTGNDFALDDITFSPQEQDPGLSGVTVYLDDNNNGILDPGESSQVTATDDPTTPDIDETGQYAFTNLLPGNYQVREVVPQGFAQTFPSRTFIGENLIVNSSFEDVAVEPPPGGFGQASVGSSAIDSWEVISGSVDYVSTELWEASDGNISLDLSGAEGDAGIISQSFSTNPGSTYRVTFDLAGSPSRVPLKEVEVAVAGQSQIFNFDTTGITNLQQLGWQSRTWDFVANDTISTLEFTSLNNSGAGPILDNVKVARFEEFIPTFHDVELEAGEIVEGLDFGNTPRSGTSGNGEIRGTKWNDLNGNGVRDGGAESGKIVVNNDEWTLSDTGFALSPDTETFVQNITTYFTGDSSGKFHAFSTNFGLTQNSLADAIESAGHTWTVGTDIDTDLESLLQFDGIFLGGLVTPAIESEILIDYVNAGGNVYLAAGVGIPGGFLAEANLWNRFLSEFGLEFVNQHPAPTRAGGYNSIEGNVPIDGTHPIFDGVSSLYQVWGNSLRDLDLEDPNNQIVQTAQGQGIYAVYDGTIRVENGLSGVTVYLDDNNNGSLDIGELTQVTVEDDPDTPDIDETGQYAFTNLEPGTYRVREVVPQGFEQTFPAIDGENLIANGSFENILSPPPIGSFSVLSPGALDIDSWEILDGPINPIDTGLWEATDGSISIDLSGAVGAAGRLAQSFPTIPGETYRVIFDLAGNPAAGPAVKELEVSAGDQSERFEFDTLGIFNLQDLGWQSKSWDFVANDTTSTLEFISLVNSAAGPAIDNVRVIRIEDTAQGFYTVELEDGEVIEGLDFGNANNGADNFAPVISSTPISTILTGIPYRYEVSATDLDGDTLTYNLIDPPAGMSIDDEGVITWSDVALGVYPIQIEVSDGNGGVATQTYDLNVVAEIIDDEDPRVNLGFSSTVFNVGDTLDLQIQGFDNVGIADLDLSFDGSSLALDPDDTTNGLVNTASVTPDGAGVFEVIATATDTAGNVDTETVQIRVIDPNDRTAPDVEIDTTVLPTVITGLTDIVGTVSGDTDFYRVELAPISSIDINNPGFPDSDYVVLAEGKGNASGVLAQIDPNLYRNDSYYIRIFAQDASGNANVQGVILGLDSQTKPGEFTQSFTDLSIPVVGIPIEVQRNYSSFNADRTGDFGFGWSLGIQDANIIESSPDGRDLNADEFFGGNSFTVGTRVTLTTPDGRRSGFTFEPTVRSAGFLGTQYAPSFTADPGVQDHLEVDFTPLQINSDGSTGLSLFGFAFNPSQYRLITKEGITYRYDQNQGLLDITDRNGNVLTYSDDGITSSTGQSIQFLRDDQGRIAEIIDPEGNSIEYGYDANGDLKTVEDRNENVTTFVYDDPNRDHYLTEVIDPLGRSGIRTEYDDQGQIARILDADGNALALDYNSIDASQTVTDPFGNQTTFIFDEQGNVAQEIDALGGVTRRTFDDDNNLTSETDPEGNTTSYTYDDRGNRLTETDPLGNTTTFTYNAENQILTEVDPLGNTFTNTYDANGNLTTRTDENGNVTTYGYDASGFGLLTSITDGNGEDTSFTYNRFSNLTSLTDPTGATYSFGYDANGNATTLTDPLGNVFTTTYDNEGRIIARTDAQNNVSRTEYNGFGDKTADIDALGRRTEYVYNDRGLLAETIFPDETPGNPNDNERIINEYDALDRLIAVTDEAGRVTRYLYDALGRQIAIIYPDDTPGNSNDNPRTASEYDKAGRLIAEIDELGNRTEFEYDADGNLILTRDALGNENRIIYDAEGRQVATIDALGQRTDFVYDGRDQQVEIRYADGTTSTTTYDANGNILTETDQEGNTTTFEYDPLGRLIGVVDALNQRTAYGRDLLGNILTQTDANGNTTTFEYNSLSQRTVMILPLGQRSTTTYDAVGNVQTVTDFNNETITYAYDPRNRLSTTTLPEGEVEQFTYTPTGQLSTVVDELGLTTYRYDERDKLLSRENPDGRTISYTYDAAGNILSLGVPSVTTRYTYDALNRLSTVTDPDNGVTGYTYNAVGNLTQTAFANGVVETRNYDNLNRLTRLENRNNDGVFASYDYDLDNVGNRTQVTENNGRVVQYEYDDLYRLTKETIIPPGETTRTIEYKFDRVGNRLERIDSVEGITTYTYDDNDRLQAETLDGLTTEYRYDNDGNLIAKLQSGENQATYEWNTKGELTAININENGSTGRVEYQYNHEGIRVSIDIDGEETQFLIDDNQQTYAQIIEEYATNNEIQTSYVYGLDLISQKQNDNRSFFQVDGLGSTRGLSDDIGNITDTYGYQAYGEILSQNGTTPNKHLFAGEQFDGSTDSYYLRARYYDQSVGRFLGRDPFEGVLEKPLSLNDFLYANSNPIAFTDPSGEVSIREYLAIAAFAVTLIDAICVLERGRPCIIPTNIPIITSVTDIEVAFLVDFGTTIKGLFSDLARAIDIRRLLDRD